MHTEQEDAVLNGEQAILLDRIERHWDALAAVAWRGYVRLDVGWSCWTGDGTAPWPAPLIRRRRRTTRRLRSSPLGPSRTQRAPCSAYGRCRPGYPPPPPGFMGGQVMKTMWSNMPERTWRLYSTLVSTTYPVVLEATMSAQLPLYQVIHQRISAAVPARRLARLASPAWPCWSPASWPPSPPSSPRSPANSTPSPSPVPPRRQHRPPPAPHAQRPPA